MPFDNELVTSLLARCRFPAPGTEVVCAVSGGADSLALLVLACAAELSVIAVHIDHGLRKGSDAEAHVVAAAAERFGARFEGHQVTIEPGPDLENRARQARLTTLASVLDGSFMTGHTADDQAETMLVNLLRGTGVRGLGAMQPGLRHPILDLRRSETEQVCAAHGLDSIDDETNRDPRFVRNRIRHEVLPLLADVAGRDPVPLMVRTAAHARRTAIDLDALAADLDPTDCRQLQDATPTLAQAALRRWLTTDQGHPPSTAELERVMAVVNNEAAACEISPSRRVSRSNQMLRVENIPAD